MEDGQTRMDACMRFKKGEFDSKWGPYTDPEIAKRFDCYQVATVLIEKARSRIRDSTYFSELNQNFIDLQEGTPLTASDRYYSQMESPSHNFKGAPLVNTTIKIATTFSVPLKNYCGIQSLNRENLRKKLAYLVAMVSGPMDLDLSNLSYYAHSIGLYKAISENHVAEITTMLTQVFGALEMALDIKPRVKNEQISCYTNLPSFMGPMFADRHKNPEESPETFMRRWAMCINDSRVAKDKGDKEWLQNTVYKGLGQGVIRNCMKEYLVIKMDAVRTHYQNLL